MFRYKWLSNGVQKKLYICRTKVLVSFCQTCLRCSCSFALQARIRILSLIAKLFAVSSSTATAIRDSNLLSLFEDEIKDRNDMLKTLSALEVLYEVILYVLVGLPSHFPLFIT